MRTIVLACVLIALSAAAAAAGSTAGAAVPAAQSTVPTARAETSGNGGAYAADGYVEAVRQSVVAAQVPGQVTALTVKAGDAVKAGQLLVRIDPRAAVQQAAASEAQVGAAQAQLEAARSEYERSKRLFQKQYISQAAMDQAQAQFKATEAQVRATLAQAGVAGTQTSFHSVLAPYAGIVSQVSVELGDMAVPGRPLVTIFDPAALRVVASLPERYAGMLQPKAQVKIELPGAADEARWQAAQSVSVLPTRDPVSHTLQVRLALPAGVKLAPGAFARAYLPLAGVGEAAALTIPLKAVVKRAEMHAVYVADTAGRFQLRQVRLGAVAGDRVTVLSGLQAGEQVALDPVAAAAR